MTVTETSADSNLQVQLGRLTLPNPILVASGTFGYAREMEKIVDLSRLGGIVPKTITTEMRVGNSPHRTVETSSGLLNSIGLDNDGIDAFIAHHLPYLSQQPAPLIVSIAGSSAEGGARGNQHARGERVQRGPHRGGWAAVPPSGEEEGVLAGLPRRTRPG